MLPIGLQPRSQGARAARNRVPRWLCPAALLAGGIGLGLTDIAYAQLLEGGSTDPLPDDATLAKIGLLLAFLGFVTVVVAYLFWYAWRLNQSFLRACNDTGQLYLYAQAPLGLPSGTVQSMLALFIVLTGVGLILLTVSGGPFGRFPETLSGVLGTVLGFYFGSRTATGVQERQSNLQITEIGRERDAAVSAKEQTRLDKINQGVRAGLAILDITKDALPEGMRKQAEGVARTVQGGLEVVETIRRAGDLEGAIGKATELAARVKDSGPVLGLLRQAATTIGPLIGGAIPAVGLILTVATIAAKLTGAAYERWMARVMSAPYTPALFDPAVIDANTGYVLLHHCPTLREAFKEEIARGDRAFILAFIRHALCDEPSETVWTAYPGRFDTLQTVDAALAEFQKAAITLEVTKDIDPGWVQQAGGINGLMSQLERIDREPAARADLDAAVMAVDKLRRSDQPVEALFKAAAAEMGGQP